MNFSNLLRKMVLSELSSFLGTLAKRCVSLTYLTWRHVPKNLKNTMWNYVKERAKKNSASRKSYTDTHTCGPKSSAQLRNKMKKKTPNESEPCFAKVFVETRERVEGREYKTDPQIIKMKILKKINEKLSTGDASDELLSERKHVPNWLLGRCVKPSKV